MNTYVAFIRAINVAGHASVKMNDVREAFAAAGCRRVRTYIQSGNVIFESPAQDAAQILPKVRRTLGGVVGGEPDILFRTAGQLEELVRRAPFKSVETEFHIKLYVVFLFGRPRIEPRFPLVSPPDALEAIAMSDREVFVVSRRKKNGFFGFPNNFIEKELGVSATSRNWSTISKMVELVGMKAEKITGRR